MLTSPSDTPGTANVDFVIFPPRWLVAENTFRPPWYPSNMMSEFMGLIYGVYDAKPRVRARRHVSLHNCMLPHGPDATTFEQAQQRRTRSRRSSTDTLAFMFETRFPRCVRRAIAAETAALQGDYVDCWQGLEEHFDPRSRDAG